MQTEYSANDVATARGLQFLVSMCASMATFLTYDYVCSLHEEWTFLLQSRWTKVKGLYIITRHVPFLLLLTVIYVCFTPNENPDNCRTVLGIYACLGVISAACSECHFVLRAYALWNNNRIVLAAMLSAFLAVAAASIYINFIHIEALYVTTSAIPGITGCYQTLQGVRMSITFVLLFAFQLGVASLTLIRAMQSWRTANSPLYTVLVKHNIFYYACGLFLSIMNVLTQKLYSNIAYRLVFECLQFLVLAILATHMHLNLWQINQHVHDSDALVYIPMSDVSPTDSKIATA